MLFPVVVLGFAVAWLADTGQAAARPFDHARHERLSCTQCHGTGARHRQVLVRSAADCAACHHDAGRARPCTTCHAALPAPREVTVAVRATASPAARARTMPVPHQRHAQVRCTECHREGPFLAPARACGSCHDRHHRADADCAGCHRAENQARHDAASHLGCAGAACHATALAPKVWPTRTLCLTCHPAQKEHAVGGQCAACHEIPAPGGGPLVAAARAGGDAPGPVTP
ncbi:MAG TPA: hypothetical protein VGD77_11885 [Gemmatimonadaceae bacterium]